MGFDFVICYLALFGVRYVLRLLTRLHILNLKLELVFFLTQCEPNRRSICVVPLTRMIINACGEKEGVVVAGEKMDILSESLCLFLRLYEATRDTYTDHHR
jgi:hypothetical protein